MGAAAVRGSGTSASSPSVSCRRALGERCGLTFRLSSCSVELLLEPVVFPAQAIPLALDSLQLAPQSFDFAILFRDGVVRVVGRRRSIGALGHAPVMPNLREKYKAEIVVPPPSAATTR
jgi:hypothetical protein